MRFLKHPLLVLLIAFFLVSLSAPGPAWADTYTHSFEKPFWEHVQVGNALGETNQVVDPPGVSTTGEYMKVWLKTGLNAGDALKRTVTVDVSDDQGELYDIGTLIDCAGTHNNTQTVFEVVQKNSAGGVIVFQGSYLPPGQLPFSVNLTDSIKSNSVVMEVSIGVRVNPSATSGGDTTCYFDYVLENNVNIPEISEDFGQPQWDEVFTGVFNDAACERVLVSGGAPAGAYAVRTFINDSTAQGGTVGCQWRFPVAQGQQVDATVLSKCEALAGNLMGGLSVEYMDGDYNNPQFDDVMIAYDGVLDRVSTWQTLSIQDFQVPNDPMASGIGYGYVNLYVRSFASQDVGLCLFDSMVLTVEPIPPVSCAPPQSGDWTVSQDCFITGTVVAPANVIVSNGATLTVGTGATLDINFSSYHLRILSGCRLIIEAGGKVQ